MLSQSIDVEFATRPFRCLTVVRDSTEFLEAVRLSTHLWGGNTHPILPSPRGSIQEREFARAVQRLDPDAIFLLERSLTKREARALGVTGKLVVRLSKDQVDHHVEAREPLRLNLGELPHPYLLLAARYPTTLTSSTIRVVPSAPPDSLIAASTFGLPTVQYTTLLREHLGAKALCWPTTYDEWIKISALASFHQLPPDVSSIGVSVSTSFSMFHGNEVSDLEAFFVRASQVLTIFLPGEEDLPLNTAIWNHRARGGRANSITIPLQEFRENLEAALLHLMEVAKPPQIVFVAALSVSEARELVRDTVEVLHARHSDTKVALVREGISFAASTASIRSSRVRKVRVDQRLDSRFAFPVETPEGLERPRTLFAIDAGVKSEFGEKLLLPDLPAVRLCLSNPSGRIGRFRDDARGLGVGWLRNQALVRATPLGLAGVVTNDREFDFFLHSEEFLVHQALENAPIKFNTHRHNRYATGFIRRSGGLRNVQSLVARGALKVLSALAFHRGQQPGLLFPQIVSALRKDFKLGHDDAKRMVEEVLPELLERQLVIRGIGPKCPECDLTEWYAVSELDEFLECPGCLARFQLSDHGLKYRFRINELARRLIQEGGRAVFESARTLKRIQPSIALSFGAEILGPSGRQAEVDLIGLTPGGLLFCECKSLFNPSSDDLDDIVESGKRLVESCVDAGVSELAVGVATEASEEDVLARFPEIAVFASSFDLSVDLILNQRFFLGGTEEVELRLIQYSSVPRVVPRENRTVGEMLGTFGMGGLSSPFDSDLISSWDDELEAS